MRGEAKHVNMRDKDLLCEMPERVPSELFQIDGQDEKEGTTQLTCSINLVNLFLVDQSRPFPMLLDGVQALMRRSGSGALAGTLLTFAVKYPGPGLGTVVFG